MPPPNTAQTDENDNNRNQKYERIDDRVRETFSADSKAQNKNSPSDPYIKVLCYAADKIGDNGVVCFVNDSAFIDSLSCDGVRKHLDKDFDLIYVLDLGGNAIF